MRQLASRLAFAGLLVTVPSVAMSQTSIDYFAQFSPGTTVGYLPFSVSIPGFFDMYTSGLNNLDPMIRLFAGASTNGPGLGASLAFNDDGGVAQPGWNRCSGAGGTCHSRINLFLAAGDYTLAFGVFNLTEAEARAGTANVGPQDLVPGTTYGQPYCNATGDWSTCNYTVSIRSNIGIAVVTPEPASLTLLATGLVGVLGAVRRNRKSHFAA